MGREVSQVVALMVPRRYIAEKLPLKPVVVPVAVAEAAELPRALLAVTW